MTVPEDQLDDLKVLETYKEGVSIYKRLESSAQVSSAAMFGLTLNNSNDEILDDHHAQGDGCFNHGLSVLINAINSAAE